jgi:hypothetical protein
MTDRVVNQFAMVHFDPGTGRIVQLSKADQVFQREGLSVAVVLGKFELSDFLNIQATQQVDLASIEFHGEDWPTARLVDKTKNEMRRELPRYEVDGARRQELVRTDPLVNYPPDRPPPPDLEEVRAYRQRLRDLGAQTTPADMVDIFPLRPDGSDPIPELRARVGR